MTIMTKTSSAYIGNKLHFVKKNLQNRLHLCRASEL